jgi:hypothetical protein
MASRIRSRLEQFAGFVVKDVGGGAALPFEPPVFELGNDKSRIEDSTGFDHTKDMVR